MALKLITFGLPASVTFFEVTQGALGFVVLLGAAMAATAMLYRGLRKWGRAVEVMLASPDWQAEASKRFDQIDQRLKQQADALTLIAETDSYRITDALAGDRRGAKVDRRS